MLEPFFVRALAAALGLALVAAPLGALVVWLAVEERFERPEEGQ